MRRMFVVGALLVLTAAAPPPMDTETRQDVRCFTVASAIVGDPSTALSAEQRMSVLGVAQYYLGRIDGRMPALNLQDAIEAEGAALAPNEMQALIASCAKLVEQRGQDLIEMGKALQEKDASKATTAA